MSIVATVAELEPLEPSCLLQKAKEQQEEPLEQQLEEQVKALVVPPAPFGSTFVCGPNCRCTVFVNSVNGLDIGNCFAHCQGFPGFIFAPNGPPSGSTDCRCCRDLDQNTPVVTEWYLYSQTLPHQLLLATTSSAAQTADAQALSTPELQGSLLVNAQTVVQARKDSSSPRWVHRPT